MSASSGNIDHSTCIRSQTSYPCVPQPTHPLWVRSRRRLGYLALRKGPISVSISNPYLLLSSLHRDLQEGSRLHGPYLLLLYIQPRVPPLSAWLAPSGFQPLFLLTCRDSSHLDSSTALLRPIYLPHLLVVLALPSIPHHLEPLPTKLNQPSHPDIMSYSWVGAPAVFNGTNEETGGDSGRCLGRDDATLCTID